MSENNARLMRTKEQRIVMARRKVEVTERALRGERQDEIAKALGLSINQVKGALRRAMADAQAAFEANANTYRGRLLTKNHHLQAELWRAYERVKERGKITQVLRKNAEGKEVPIEITQSTAPEAEARILQAILKAQEQEGRIFGLVGDTRPSDVPAGPTTVNDNRTLVIVNHAGLDSDIPWLQTIPPMFVKQGVGLLPKGSPDPEAPIDAEVA